MTLTAFCARTCNIRVRQSQSHLCRWQTCLYQPVYSKSHFFKAREGGLCNSQRRKSILVMCETHLPLMAWFLKLWMWEVIFSTLGGGAGKSLGLCCHWGGQWHWGGHVRWQTGRLHMLSTYLCSFSFCMHLQRKGLSYLQEEWSASQNTMFFSNILFPLPFQIWYTPPKA